MLKVQYRQKTYSLHSPTLLLKIGQFAAITALLLLAAHPF